jgi:iron complex transport system substrate-binding protein
MSRLDSVNLAALVIALVVAAVGTLQFTRSSASSHAAPALESTGGIARVVLDDGRQAVRDAQGTAIPLGNYTRIISLGLESDALLAELCERDRLAGVSIYHRGTTALRLAGLPRFAGLDDLESVITLAPDLVLVSSSADQLDRLARLRQSGLTVCNLGPQRGVASLVPNARLIGVLIGADARAERFVATFTQRLANVDASLPPDRVRRRALYLGVYSREIYCGTVGSSYHDVLTAAGLIDVAAEQHSGWPKLSLEDVIALNPEVIVLSVGSATALRALPGIEALQAVTDGHLLILDDGLLEDPGPGLLDAAEALFRLAYPSMPASTPAAARP